MNAEELSIISQVIDEFKSLLQSLDGKILKSLLKRLFKWIILLSVFMNILPLIVSILIPENSDLVSRILTSIGLMAFFSMFPLITRELDLIFEEILLDHGQNQPNASFLFSRSLVVMIVNVIFLALAFVFLFVLELIQNASRAPIVLSFVFSADFLWFLAGLVVLSVIQAKHHVRAGESGNQRILIQLYTIDLLFFVPFSLYMSYGATLVEMLPFKIDATMFSLIWKLLLAIVLLFFVFFSLRGDLGAEREL